ncbi:MAG: serine/threonine protein phosphatase [Sphingomonadales bacterium]|nr:MAG: serine/threonine protein phosphatase [Sphingomonadales bacterium]
MPPPIYFAIGDVHGEATKLRQLHGAILDRIAFEGQPAKIVHLGDYVDRGPDSRSVIDQIMALEQRFDGNRSVDVISLMGNHEQMMLDAYDAPHAADGGMWWEQGGAATTNSYGSTDTNWRAAVPKEHISWMRRLPGLLHDTERKLVFVHAGIEPATFPQDDQRTYLWTRSERFFQQWQWPDRDELKGLMVVHGHTPKSFDPEIYPHRINVDTGAVFGGPLTAVMLKEGARPQFLRTN